MDMLLATPHGFETLFSTRLLVGGGFQVSWTPRLEWLAWPLAWLLEFVGLSRWLP